jgi:hypothetical protein
MPPQKDIPMTTTDIDNTKCSRLRKRLDDAHRDFRLALDDYDGLPAQWERLHKRFGDVVKAMRHAETCSGEFDLPEQQHLADFLMNTVKPFIAYWRDALENSDTSIDDIDGASACFYG